MTNADIADTFDRIANLLEIKGEIIYKVLAYRRAAESIRTLTGDLANLSEKEILAIPNVGQAITEKIQELLRTGQLDFLIKLETEVPSSLLDLLLIQDVGPKKVALFWKQVGVTNLQELERIARAGKLKDLPGMGEKSEVRILSGIDALKQARTRLPIHKALEIANEWLIILRKIQGVDRLEIAGSLRRWKTSIGDLDFVGSSNVPGQVMQTLVNLPGILKVISQGENKTSVEIADHLNMQVWLQPTERFGSLWQFVTGSKEHNIRLREFAVRKGLSLSERGFLNHDLKEILCPNEVDVYQNLHLAWIPPELREDQGEIQASQTSTLPDLVTINDIFADLHTHSHWTDGKSTLEEMVQAAISRKISVIAITDHSISVTGSMAGMDAKRLDEQKREIQKLQEKYGDTITILHGIEAEVGEDGNLDLPDEVFASLDIVVASLHFSFNQSREVITRRLIKVIQHPHVDVIAHPGGREVPRTEGNDIDWEKVFRAAQENQVALEINSNPIHLDLNEKHARAASEMGVLISINTDAHSVQKFENLKFGVSIARRGWVQKTGIINTWPTRKLLSWLKNRK